MTDLPNGWIYTTLGELSEKPQYGWTTKARHEGPGLHLLRTTDITSGEIDWTTVPWCSDEPSDSDKYRLSDGDIVVSRAGSVGVSILLREPKESVFASYLIRLRPRPDVVPEYLAWFLHSPRYWQQIAEASSGIALQNVNASKLAKVEIPLAPLAEQKRIVEAIEEHFTRIDAAEAVLRRLQSKVFRILVASRISVFREPRMTVTLDSRATTQLGKMLSKKSKTGIGSAPYLRNKNVRWGRVDVSDVAEMDFSDDERTKFKLEYNDVLVCEGGAGVGRAAIWKNDLESCYFQKALHRVRPGPDLLPEFLVQYFHHLVESNDLQHHLSGVAIGHLPQEDLRKLPLPDLDLDQQERVVETLSVNESLVQSIVASTTNALFHSAVLRRSLLARAFCGRLANQNAADEPADLLLERIQPESRRARSTPGGRSVEAAS